MTARLTEYLIALIIGAALLLALPPSALAQTPADDLATLNTQAEAHYAAGRLSDAATTAEAAYALTKQVSTADIQVLRAIFNLAGARFEQGRVEESGALLAETEDRFLSARDAFDLPTQSTIRLQLALLAQKLKTFDAAARNFLALNEVYSQLPDLPPGERLAVHTLLASVYLDSNQPIDAILIVRDGVRADPPATPAADNPTFNLLAQRLYIAHGTIDFERERDRYIEIGYAAVEAVSALVGDTHEMSHELISRVLNAQFAEERYREVLALVPRWTAFPLNDNEVDYARSLAEGLMVFAQSEATFTNDLERARDQAELALALTEVLPEQDRLMVGLAEKHLAGALMDLGEIAAAEPHLRRALAIIEAETDDPEERGGIVNLMALYLDEIGETDQALVLYERSLQLLRDAPADDPIQRNAEMAILSINLSKANRAKGEYDLALEQAQEAVRLWDKIAAARDLKRNEKGILATAYEGLAEIAWERDERGQVRAHLAEARRLREEAYPKGHLAIANGLVNQIFYVEQLDGPDAGNAVADQVLDIFAQSLPPDHNRVGAFLAEEAARAVVTGRWSDAARHQQAAIAIWTAPTRRADIGANLDVFEQQAWLSLAAPGDQARDVDRAYRTLQWTQRAAAADALSAVGTRLQSGDPKLAELIRARQDAQDALDGVARRMTASLAQESLTPDTRSSLYEAYAAARERIDTLDQELRAEDDSYDDLLAEAPLSIAETQALLGPEEVLITFGLPSFNPDVIPGLEGSSNYVIAVSADSVDWAWLPDIKRSTLVDDIANLRCAAARTDPNCQAQPSAQTDQTRGAIALDVDEDETDASALGFDFALAADLYRRLLGPVESAIAKKDHVIVAAPAVMSGLPFSLLITKQPQDGTLPTSRTANWLIRRQSLSSIPSIASLRSLRGQAQATPAPKPFLGVGDPVIQGHRAIDCATEAVAVATRAAPAHQPIVEQSNAGVSVADVAAIASLPALPDTRCELEAIAATLGGDPDALLLGEDATETQLKVLNAAGALADYRVLTFATHGLVAGEIGATEPALVMTPPSEGSPEDDGLLTASEVAALRLNADWIVLSACNTAAGAEPGAEGLSGLARGFFFAGARALLVSHWPVYSDAAVRLTTGAFGAMARDPSLGRAGALRAAILAVLDDPTSDERALHPSYWAPFDLVGEGA